MLLLRANVLFYSPLVHSNEGKWREIAMMGASSSPLLSHKIPRNLIECPKPMPYFPCSPNQLSMSKLDRKYIYKHFFFDFLFNFPNMQPPLLVPCGGPATAADPDAEEPSRPDGFAGTGGRPFHLSNPIDGSCIFLYQGFSFVSTSI